jgi:outer membrane protein OmpA-like peptidoglycan-associated protein/flagellar hook assembly protein FlgD
LYPNAYDYGIVTLGAGYTFDSSTFAGSINYSFSFYQGKDFIHYLSLNFEYGTLDRIPPDIAVKPDNTYISPNYDGTKDFVIFKTEVKDESRIKGWRLQVLDANSNVVKEFKMSERDMNRSLTFTGFFKRISQKKESLMVPDSIMWDGTDKQAKTVPDGKYSYSFTAWDERENIAAQKHGIIFIDNTIPKVSVEATEALFSPNGDGKKDTFTIKQNIVTSPDDIWTASFNDSSGKAVRTYTWTAEIPLVIIWDGKDDNGANVPEGLYSYTIQTTDKAGNNAKTELREIALTRQYETADITMSQEFFSFGKDTNINLFPQLTKTDGLEEWQIVITDAEKKPVNTLIYPPEFQRLVKWDCTDAKKRKLDDGIYYIKLLTRFKSGNTPESFDRKLVIDSTPPALKVSHKPVYFSPDSDGENDICTIMSSAEDFTGIKKWTITIFAPDGTIFKSYTGTAPVPPELNWDGVGTNGEIVESAADYFIQLEASDLSGNIAKSNKDKLQVDILVVITERGLKMRISNIEFAFDSALLTYNGKKILDRVYVILQKYERYDVVVEGHTDDIGKEDYNLTLSENRAKAVHEYLVKEGITEERIEFIGKGETVSLYPNTNEENRRRNRRVEFLLIKKDKEAESLMPDVEEPEPTAIEPGGNIKQN